MSDKAGYVIDKERCTACGLCADICPVEAISQIGQYTINKILCTVCGICKDDCPSKAIDRIINVNRDLKQHNK
jgi:formate hydrogenlyase subunit 6/NADH:ubiquinone oxidoreductase subunit I